MNAATATLVVLAAVFAVGNWVSRVNGSRALEYATKPAVTALLALAALTVDARDDATRAWFFVALVLSLAGDVFLMLPKEQFVAGLASFLLAHVAYVIGFGVGGLHRGGLFVGGVVVVAVLLPLGRTIVRAARRTEPAVAGPVAIYVTVIAIMVMFAFGSQIAWAIAGAVLFAASDSMIAWDRFVRRFRWAPLAIMVTYHLGQTGLLLSLMK